MINHEHQPYLSLRDSISSLFKSKSSQEEFWALKDINFNVMPGDTVGIIGKNGAGKSTLLKILSKITPPTSGRIVGRGRIASLLEVGTGFHPELSGRENIFMNGSILGMRKAEIQKNFDAIVDFSGVEKFIDTPLKHYSSGMQLRLAFAVAAFLENEILIIDEVLAVGDAEFQKKCIGKMEDVSKSGRTILFVSHQFSAIKKLCKHGIFLKNGMVEVEGNMDDVIQSYSVFIENEFANKDKAHSIQENDFSFEFDNASKKRIFSIDEDVDVSMKFKRPQTDASLTIGVALKDRFEKRVMIDFYECKTKEDFLNIKFTLPKKILTPGRYFIDLSLQTNYEQFWIKNNILSFEIDIQSTNYEGLNYDYGLVCSTIRWQQK